MGSHSRERTGSPQDACHPAAGQVEGAGLQGRCAQVPALALWGGPGRSPVGPPDLIKISDHRSSGFLRLPARVSAGRWPGASLRGSAGGWPGASSGRGDGLHVPHTCGRGTRGSQDVCCPRGPWGQRRGKQAPAGVQDGTCVHRQAVPAEQRDAFLEKRFLDRFVHRFNGT